MNFETLLKKTGNALGLLLLYLWDIIADALYSLWDALTSKGGYNAAFGKETDIAKRYNKGLLISRNRKLPIRTSFENLMIAGPTGSGKTSRLLIKILFHLKKSSVLINDPSGEVYKLLSGFLKLFFNIIVINFSDSAKSSGYNILSRIWNLQDVNKIADLLVRATIDKGSSDPFWGLQSRNIIGCFIRLTLYQPEQYRHMGQVLFFLNLYATQPKQIDLFIIRTQDKKLILDYKSLVAMPQKTLLNIVASAKAALQIFESPEIAKVTSVDHIDFEEFRKKPTIIFLRNSIAEQKFISTLNSIFFEQFYGYILSKLPEKDDLNVFIILEECSSLYIPGLPIYIANTRKHKVSNILCVQSPNQLSAFYGDEAKNIYSNCVTKIFLPGQTDLQVMRDIEALSGKYIYKDKEGIERSKPLVTIDEIRRLPKNRTLIISSNNPLILGRTSPYYTSGKYKKVTQLPPAELESKIPDTPLPLLEAPEEVEAEVTDEDSK